MIDPLSIHAHLGLITGSITAYAIIRPESSSPGLQRLLYHGCNQKQGG